MSPQKLRKAESKSQVQDVENGFPDFEFGNRSAEIEEIEALLDGSQLDHQPVCLIFCCYRSSGATRFLKHAFNRFAQRVLTLKVDGFLEDPRGISSQLARQLDAQRVARMMNSRTKNRSIKSALKSLSYLVTFIPWVGSFFSKAIEEFAIPAFSGNSETNESVAVLRMIWRELQSRPLLLLIDNAQSLRRRDFLLLRDIALTQNSRVWIVMAAMATPLLESSAVGDDLVRQLSSVGLPARQVPFRSPDTDFIREVSAANRINLTQDRADQICILARGNIYSIVRELQSLLSQALISLSPLEKRVLAYLAISKMPISRGDLLSLLVDDEALIFNQDEFSLSIERLTRRSLVATSGSPQKAKVLFLASHSSSEVTSSLPGEVDRLYIKNCLYQYMSLRHSDSEDLAVRALIYRLSKIVDPARVPHWAQKLVAATLRAEDALAVDEVLQDVGGITTWKSFEDFAVYACANVSVKKYGRTVKMIDELPVAEWKEARIVQVVHAVALNRTRQHRRSLDLINHLMPDSKVSEETAILASFKISGLLHEGKVREAERTFYEYRFRLKRADNYAYFLRNGSAALKYNDAIEVLRHASRVFRRKQDEFGFWTAQVGIAGRNCSVGHLEKSLPALKRACSVLVTYGHHHVEEAKSNLALALLLLEHSYEAEVHLTQLLAFATENVPKMYALGHLAFLNAQKGRVAEALDFLSKGSKLAEVIGVSGHRRRFFANAALTACVLGLHSTQVEQWLQHMEAERVDPSPLHSRVIGHYARDLSLRGKSLEGARLRKIYFSRFMEYWSQQPIELVSRLLSPQARSKYM